jgi:transcriptional accessory protein Tex/SPT6
LWNNNISENGILSMNLHPYQSFVSSRKLVDALDLVAVEVVNLIGIDINDLKDR